MSGNICKCAMATTFETDGTRRLEMRHIARHQKTVFADSAVSLAGNVWCFSSIFISKAKQRSVTAS